MDRTGATVVTPQPPPPGPREPLLTCGPTTCGAAWTGCPGRARAWPWRLNQTYFRDVLLFRHGPVSDEVEFR